MRVVPRRTVVDDIDRRFDNLSGSHHQNRMTSAQVVETSVSVTNNSPPRDYSHPGDQTTQTTETPGFKPFTINILVEYERPIESSPEKGI